VLGGLNDLNYLIKKHAIDKIVLTIDIPDSDFIKLKNIASQSSVKLVRWRTEFIPLLT
jgi:hypothetical protein